MEMTMRPADRQPVLSDADSQVITQGVKTLPGDWYLDPLGDPQPRGRPTAWIREGALTAPGGRAISFKRRGTSIWVSMHDESTNAADTVDELPFDTAPAAFIYLRARLLAQLPDVEMDAPASGNEWKSSLPSPSGDASSPAPGMHPRILERITRVALARKQDMLLAQLDRMVDSVNPVSEPTGRSLTQTMQDIRNRLMCLGIENASDLIILDEIQQEMADLQADFVVFDPTDAARDG